MLNGAGEGNRTLVIITKSILRVSSQIVKLSEERPGCLSSHPDGMYSRAQMKRDHMTSHWFLATVCLPGQEKKDRQNFLER